MAKKNDTDDADDDDDFDCGGSIIDIAASAANIHIKRKNFQIFESCVT